MGCAMADKCRIVSENGRTKVFDESGQEMKLVTGLEIKFTQKCVLAYITVVAINPDIDINVIAEVRDGR